MKLLFNFFCDDIESQLGFYRALLDLPEAAYTRSTTYRAVHTPEFQFGFQARATRRALGLPAAARGARSAQGYPTFLLDSPEAVDALTARARALGGAVVREPFATPYGQWQAVIADPERNIVRLACDELPQQPARRDAWADTLAR